MELQDLNEVQSVVEETINKGDSRQLKGVGIGAVAALASVLAVKFVILPTIRKIKAKKNLTQVVIETIEEIDEE